MKIDDTGNKATNLGPVANQSRAAKPTEKGGVEKAPTKSTDTVSLSSQSQALAGTAKSGAVFDVAKVQELKDAIASGRFQVDASKVADGLLDMARALASPPKG